MDIYAFLDNVRHVLEFQRKRRLLKQIDISCIEKKLRSANCNTNINEETYKMLKVLSINIWQEK